MWTMLAGVPGKLKTLLDRLTATRAANLDNLNATVTSRAPAATALSNAVWTDARAAKLDAGVLATGVVRSVQGGWVNAAPSTGTIDTEDHKYCDVTISAVDVSRSTVVFVGGSTTGGLQSAFTRQDSSTGSSYECTARLTSSTVLRISAPGGSGNNPTKIAGRWTVVEYA
ncbi:hypothetical protein [Thauera humireducens]|uniref:hypothetical protein n=1 Tax=Thauera humireducens TaxID=1134435 RepID=UPI00311E65A3